MFAVVGDTEHKMEMFPPSDFRTRVPASLELWPRIWPHTSGLWGLPDLKSTLTQPLTQASGSTLFPSLAGVSSLAAQLATTLNTRGWLSACGT